MSSFFHTLIDQGFAIVYIKDVLTLADSKPRLLELIEQLDHIERTKNLESALKKSFYIILAVKLLGHEIT